LPAPFPGGPLLLPRPLMVGHPLKEGTAMPWNALSWPSPLHLLSHRTSPEIPLVPSSIQLVLSQPCVSQVCFAILLVVPRDAFRLGACFSLPGLAFPR
jgi:hypothetical protein